MSGLGLDIGGGNLKAADGAGWTRSVPFALWRNPQGLSQALAALIEHSPPSARLAVTMTGELCDCFRSKADGVEHILAAVQEVANGKEIGVYLVDGRFVSVAEAMQLPLLAAASNWRALAQFACRYVEGCTALLIDIGSTTTDIVPLVEGRVAARGRNDTERLATRELLYSGVGRTPVCALVRSLPWRGQSCPIAAEVFSTTADAYILLDDIQEDPRAEWTADGRPLTAECARQRLARQLCADADEIVSDDFHGMARVVREAQLNQLAEGITATVANMRERPGVVVLSGSGEFLGRTAVEQLLEGCRVISLADRLGAATSCCAPAHAVAVLAAEDCGRTPLEG